jgi:threonine dehydrogenase-like Zn-dependent dehydrogenase
MTGVFEMPRRIVTTDGKSFRSAEYELAQLGAGDIRVKTEFAAPKHGTEQHSLGGSAFDRKVWDKELRMFLPKPESDEPPAPSAPTERGIGNMVVGTVSEVGPEVTRWRVGDRVFGYGQIREVVQGAEGAWYPLGDLTPEDAVCVDPAHVAFVAVRDGNVRIGDSVAVYGLGAIGLLAVQIARAGGARKVFAVDPLAIRREYALAHGADAAFDPTTEDAALQIKLATDKAGADVSIETSGNGRALHDAIRCIRQCGTVVHVPWGPKDATPLRLDEEFHLNRPTLVGSQAWSGWGNPDRDYPLWTWDRAYSATIELFRAGLITGRGLVTPVADFDDAPGVLAEAFARPETAIKSGVRFTL